MECPHNNKDTLEDGSTLICTDCGAVLDEVVLSAVDFIETPAAPTAPVTNRGPLIATKIHQKSYNERNRDRLAAFLSQMSTHFGWSGETESILSHFDDMIRQQRTDFGRGGDRTIAALYLLKGRLNQIPLTLNRVADFMGESPSLLGKECMTVMQIFPDLRYTSSTQRFFELHMQFADVSDDAEKRRIRTIYNSLLRIAHQRGLDEGRYPEPFAVALTAISIDSVHPASASCCEQLCQQVGVSPRTVYKRYTEIKKLILQVARERLPWGQQVRNGNVLEFVEDVIRVETEVFEPPSYVKATRESAERASLIERVLSRRSSLAAETTESSGASDTTETTGNDPDEFIVEYLLSIGYTTNEIMALPRLSFDLIL